MVFRGGINRSMCLGIIQLQLFDSWNMNNHIGKKVLVTTQSWFYGKDGKQYRAIHGTLKGIHEAGKTLGFIPNRSHANWFIEVGSMVIMGCQVLYFDQVDEIHGGPVIDWTDAPDDKGKAKNYERPTAIYISE